MEDSGSKDGPEMSGATPETSIGIRQGDLVQIDGEDVGRVVSPGQRNGRSRSFKVQLVLTGTIDEFGHERMIKLEEQPKERHVRVLELLTQLRTFRSQTQLQLCDVSFVAVTLDVNPADIKDHLMSDEERNAVPASTKAGSAPKGILKRSRTRKSGLKLPPIDGGSSSGVRRVISSERKSKAKPRRVTFVEGRVSARPSPHSAAKPEPTAKTVTTKEKAFEVLKMNLKSFLPKIQHCTRQANPPA